MLDLDQNQIEEALKTYRELAQKDPQTFLPKVALTLNNLGILYSVQSRMKKERDEYEEALKIYREAAQKDTGIYLPEVAMTLNNLGILDRNQNRMAEARKEYQEALKIYEALATQDPEQFTIDVERLKRFLNALPKESVRSSGTTGTGTHSE